MKMKRLSILQKMCYDIDEEKERKWKEVLKMKETRKIKTLYLGPRFMENLLLPKEYRLERDLLPPNIR